MINKYLTGFHLSTFVILALLLTCSRDIKATSMKEFIGKKLSSKTLIVQNFLSTIALYALAESVVMILFGAIYLTKIKYSYYYNKKTINYIL